MLFRTLIDRLIPAVRSDWNRLGWRARQVRRRSTGRTRLRNPSGGRDSRRATAGSGIMSASNNVITLSEIVMFAILILFFIIFAAVWSEHAPRWWRFRENAHVCDPVPSGVPSPRTLQRGRTFEEKTQRSSLDAESAWTAEVRCLTASDNPGCRSCGNTRRASGGVHPAARQAGPTAGQPPSPSSGRNGCWCRGCTTGHWGFH